jgi:hypothetical protein
MHMLCYVMLCYVMLCCVVLCCVVLCCVVLCYVMLCYVVLCYVMLCYVVLCCVMLCYVVLCYVVLCYVMLCYVTCIPCCQKLAVVQHRTGVHKFSNRLQNSGLQNGRMKEVPYWWPLPSKILAATPQNLVATAIRRTGFVRPSLGIYMHCISRTVN